MATRTATMNIKDPEVYRLARELAELTGESLTEAVGNAVRERLEREQRQKRKEDAFVERILAIGREIRERNLEYWRTLDIDAMLHDVNGLPK